MKKNARSLKFARLISLFNREAFESEGINLFVCFSRLARTKIRANSVYVFLLSRSPPRSGEAIRLEKLSAKTAARRAFA